MSPPNMENDEKPKNSFSTNTDGDTFGDKRQRLHKGIVDSTIILEYYVEGQRHQGRHVRRRVFIGFLAEGFHELRVKVNGKVKCAWRP